MGKFRQKVGIYEGGLIQPNLTGLLSLGGGMHTTECHFQDAIKMSTVILNQILSYCCERSLGDQVSLHC